MEKQQHAASRTLEPFYELIEFLLRRGAEIAEYRLAGSAEPLDQRPERAVPRADLVRGHVEPLQHVHTVDAVDRREKVDIAITTRHSDLGPLLRRKGQA